MKTMPGKWVARVLLALIPLFASPALAAVTAEVDRTRIAMGDTLRLTLSATDGEDVGEANLQPLLADFEILHRSTSTNMSFINGKRSTTRQQVIELSPKREGFIDIPAIEIDKLRTRPLRIAVTAAPEINTEGQPVMFEATLDRDRTYVQGQVILTLRLQLAIQLESGNIPELALDNAFVRQLERNSFLRTIDGRPWRVHEVRYAVFPEQSGTLVIPAQTFSGRINEGRRGLFDLSRGRLIRRTSEALSIEVMPRPDDFPGATWLPARNLNLEESWSTPPEQLRAGESATRTIRIVGEGLQGAQLPPILFPPIDGLKYYPDQPQIDEQEVDSGLQGVRLESAALVPTRGGDWTIPETRIPWWDIESEQVRFAVLPARQISVSAPAPANVLSPMPSPDPTSTPAPDALAGATGGNTLPWQIATVLLALGWVATTLLLLRRREPAGAPAIEQAGSRSEKDSFRRLLKACQMDNPRATREALVNWGATLPGSRARPTLQSLAAQLHDPAFTAALEELETELYRDEQDGWTGAALADCIKRLRPSATAAGDPGDKLRLYPGTEPAGSGS